LTSPTRLPAELEDVLVRLRKQQAEAGWDYGATAVLLQLLEEPDAWPDDCPFPCRATVNRVFEARGLLAKTPQRRPRRRSRRFARREVNALWQFDGFETALADGTTGWVLHLSEDCSRVDLALQAAVSENGADVIATFQLAVARYGLPAQLLTDNGSAFSGRRRGWTSAFEQYLTDLGVQALTSRVSHPQTCGKNERAHQRVQKWLARRPPARDLTELQDLLDNYREAYNHRRNAVLDGLRPNERFDLGPVVGPDPDLPTITHLSRHRVAANGSIGLNGYFIGLGKRHAGRLATAFRNGDHVIVFVEDTYARDLTIDPGRRYQPVQ
jgi:transposase InsO family protein